jgi:hypothetical protein
MAFIDSAAASGASSALGSLGGIAGMLNPISAGLNAVGSLFKGITGFFSGEAQARQEKIAAHEAAMQGGVNASLALMQGNATAEQGAAVAAANGGGFVGSSVSLIQSLSGQAMYNARATAYRAREQEEADFYQASVDKAGAWSSLIGGAMGAAGSIVGGAAQSAFRNQILQSRASILGLGGDPGPDWAVPS